ncbi:MAG: GNAT family N-acetyltransferase [Isosphaeraceae bacterium]
MFIPSIRYGFIRARQLEGSYPGDPKLGVWPITHNRTLFGWGQVDEDEWPYPRKDEFVAPEPPGLDESAKRHRVHHYQRIRSSSEARSILERKGKIEARLSNGHSPREVDRPLEVKVAFEITEEFLHAPRGLINNPPAGSQVIGVHAVPLLGYSRSQHWFEFHTLWAGWGDNQRGYMPLDFFDNWMTDSWCIDKSSPDLPNVPGIHELRWEAPDPLGDQLYGLELYDGDADERMAWSFAVHRGGHLDIEEFYVKPAYRRRGHGSRLSEMVRELSEKIGFPLRAWIPYADCEQTNRPALTSILAKLRLNVRRSGVRWAAYRATPSKRKDIIFDPIDVPPRPAFAKKSWPVATAGSVPAKGEQGAVSYGGPLTDEALCAIADALFCALDAEEAVDGQP